MSDNTLSEIDESCRLVKQAARAESLWSFDVVGEVSYRIERYLCMEGGRILPATPCPIVGVQFSGKKVSAMASLNPSAQAVVSMPNVTLIIPGDRESFWEIRGMLDFVMIYFTGEAQQKLRHLITGQHYPMALRDDLSGAVVRQLATQLQQQEPQNPQNPLQQDYMAALSNALFHQVSFMLRNPDEHLELDMAGTRYPFVQEVISYIHNHLDEKLSVDALAAQAGLQQSHFRDIFKRATGYSLHRYINKSRMEKAQKMLATTDISIIAMAEELGFSSQSHMTMAFKRYYDITPAQFRKRKASGTL